mgnify:FL=1
MVALCLATLLTMPASESKTPQCRIYIGAAGGGSCPEARGANGDGAGGGEVDERGALWRRDGY